MTIFTYSLDDQAVTTIVEGETLYGGPEVLIEKDDDLSFGTSWAELGYTITRFLDPPLLDQLRRGIRELVKDVLREGDVAVDDSFELETYHLHGGNDPRLHAILVEGIKRGFPLTRLPIDYHIVERRIGEIVGFDVTAHNKAYGLDVFNMRIVRPASPDNNPLHRDVWLDRLRNAINIYVPLAGSDEHSSLPLVPGSHRWSEDAIARTAAGAKLNGFTYTVPAVVGAKHPLRLVRPNPGPDEILIFSPYLIHGGAANHNGDRTRASLEMRFWRRVS